MYMYMCIIEQMDFMWEMLFQLKNGGKADLIFNNDYGQDENKDTTHDVVIKK